MQWWVIWVAAMGCQNNYCILLLVNVNAMFVHNVLQHANFGEIQQEIRQE
jgi:hypothetical protein